MEEQFYSSTRISLTVFANQCDQRVVLWSVIIFPKMNRYYFSTDKAMHHAYQHAPSANYVQLACEMLINGSRSCVDENLFSRSVLKHACSDFCRGKRRQAWRKTEKRPCIKCRNERKSSRGAGMKYEVWH